MQTVVVEVLNDKAVPLLRNLENLDIIRLTPQNPQPGEQPETSAVTGRLSEQFWGCISPETAADLHRQLDESRNRLIREPSLKWFV